MQKFKELFLFGLIGVVGFLVDSGVLYLLKDALGLYVGRGVSFVCAVLATWILNKLITFRKSRSGHSALAEALRYGVCMLSGGAVNYLTYWALVTYYALAQHYPILGVAAGSLTGMIFNYSTARLFVFNQETNLPAPAKSKPDHR
ncbi:GtrA family protein [Acerihabitans arboris]|uniref:GtrA family protein n=1 Tax=Acerihabitans arboris TaxID=2691583 RepID=A0A845SRJ1_9GAMM|nr:GtrA family protein [Acerihabitans arboris]NDL65717.1 GtrA family protein [Acerihabitans arboris]